MEFTVLIHGTLVAVMQGNGIWPMFLFGFAGMFVITQMHGLGLKLWQKWLILAVYIGSVTLVYSQRGWAQLNEIVRIPVIEYLAVVVLALIFGGGLWVAGKIRVRRPKERGRETTAGARLPDPLTTPGIARGVEARLRTRDHRRAVAHPTEGAIMELSINGQVYTVADEPDRILLWVLRDELGLTGTKFGCGIGMCGSCTVLVDGQPTRSCITPLSAVAGKSILTLEGLADDRRGRRVDPAPRAARLRGGAGPPVRLLHDRPDADRGGAAAEQPPAQRGRDRRRHGSGPLPLRRLRAHQAGRGAGGRDRRPGGWAMSERPPQPL